MKIVVFGPEQRVGAWEGEKVIDLNRAFASYLRDQRGDLNVQEQADSRVPSRLEPFITAGPGAIEDAQRAIEHAVTVSATSDAAAIVHYNSEVKIHAPWPGRRIACVGGNYAAHLAGMGAGRPCVTGDRSNGCSTSRSTVPMRLTNTSGA